MYPRKLTLLLVALFMSTVVGCLGSPKREAPKPLYLSYAERITPELKAKQANPACHLLAVDQLVHRFALVISPYLKGYYRLHGPMQQQTLSEGILLHAPDDEGVVYHRFRCDDSAGELYTADGTPLFSKKSEWPSKVLIPGISVTNLVCSSTISPQESATLAATCTSPDGQITTERYIFAPGLIVEVLNKGNSDIKEYFLVPNYLQSQE